jgi:hypothetical protein
MLSAGCSQLHFRRRHFIDAAFFFAACFFVAAAFHIRARRHFRRSMTPLMLPDSRWFFIIFLLFDALRF